MRSAVPLVLAMVLLAAQASPLRAEKPVRVAVLPLETGATDVGLGAAAADLVSASLALSADLRLVEREAVEAVLAERSLAGMLGDREGIGRLLPADVLVAGAVGAHEDGWRLTLEAVRVPGGEVLGAVVADDDRAHLGRAVETAVEELRSSLGATPPETRVVPDRAAAASLHVLRGFGLARAGLHVEAIGAFLEARRLDARLPETALWMARAYRGAGRHEHAAIAFRAFLAAAAEDHGLVETARAELAESEVSLRAEARRAKPRPRRSLTEVLLSDASDEERRAAVDATIARGREGAAELAAAVDLPFETDLGNRILLGLADVDPELFVRTLMDKPDRIGAWPGDVRRRLQQELTPAVAHRAAAALGSAHAVERRGADRFFGMLVYLSFPEAALEPYREAIRVAGASEDEARSLDALRLDPTSEANAGVIASRLQDERFSAKYRAELVTLSTKLVLARPEVLDALLEMLGDENEEIRRAAGLHLGWGLGSPGRDQYEMARSARARVAARAGELIASRRFPGDAAWLVFAGGGLATVPNVEHVVLDLLRSDHPRERQAGLDLLYRGRDRDPPAAFKAAKVQLRDDTHENVQLAIAVIAETGEPSEAEALLFGWWREQVARGGEDAQIFRSHYESSVQFACRTLARRIDPRTRERPPARGTGPDAYAAYLERVRTAKNGPASGVERER